MSPSVIVFVGGFLAPRDPELDRSYWGEAAVGRREGWRTIVAHVSPVASLHDRACQLYYALKGGRTFYGDHHSKCCGHAAHDRRVVGGEYPEWSSTNPIHFVGHSLGGNTIRYMCQMFKEGFFSSKPGDAEQPSPRWIASITCICSPLNGAPVVYGLGGDVGGTEKVTWGSGGFGLSAAIAMVEGSKAIVPWDEWCAKRSCRGVGALLDFGLGHFFRQHERHYCDLDDESTLSSQPTAAKGCASVLDMVWAKSRALAWALCGIMLWLHRLLLFVYLFLRQFAVPTFSGFARGASPRARAAGFGVFTSVDNLAYDAQVKACLNFNERVADFGEGEEDPYLFAIAGTRCGHSLVEQRSSADECGHRQQQQQQQQRQQQQEEEFTAMGLFKKVFYGLLRRGEVRCPQAFPVGAAAVRDVVAELFEPLSTLSEDADIDGTLDDAHDGVCPVRSQIYPLLLASASSSSNEDRFRAFRLSRSAPSSAPLERGVWYWETIPVDHLGVVVAPACLKTQRLFFDGLFRRLALLPVASRSTLQNEAASNGQRSAMRSAMATATVPEPLPWSRTPSLKPVARKRPSHGKRSSGGVACAPRPPPPVPPGAPAFFKARPAAAAVVG